MVAELFAVSYYGIAALAVLWKYSKLPDIEWRHITAGAMMLFAAAAIPVLNQALMSFVDASTILAPLADIVSILGALLVILGALKNAQLIAKKHTGTKFKRPISNGALFYISQGIISPIPCIHF